MREIGVDEDDIAALGIQWHDATDGRWAVVDEGQLRALMILEQRQPSSRRRLARVRRELVPGTGTLLTNEAAIAVELAADTSNTINVQGEAVDLPHERILLVLRAGQAVAVRAGATQHWTEEPEAPTFEETPQGLTVPAVGSRVAFERVLLNPQDELVLKCRYRFSEKEE
jgi:hypothetical protein